MRADTSPISVELAASIANTKITRNATITPRPMYIHHIGHPAGRIVCVTSILHHYLSEPLRRLAPRRPAPFMKATEKN